MPQNPFQGLDMHRKVGLSMIDLQRLWKGRQKPFKKRDGEAFTALRIDTG